jgi:hypothetical protein
MADWMMTPLRLIIYVAERIVASVFWGLNQAGFFVVDLLGRLLGALVGGSFRLVIDGIAGNVLGVSRAAFELALVVGLLLIMLAPIVVVRFVNVRRAVAFAFIIPIVVPLGGAIFQELEDARLSMGTTIYQIAFNNSGFSGILGDLGGNGAERDMGPLMYDARPSVGALDVAAGYLYVSRDDVVSPASGADLPQAFADKYFVDPETMGQLSASDQWAQIVLASKGIRRMVFGSTLVFFAFLETFVNLAFTFSMGFLLSALLLSLMFVFFSSMEHVTITIFHTIVQLFIASWSVSFLQGVILAFLVDVADSGNPVAVQGVGTFGAVLEIIFLLIAVRSIFSGVMGVIGVLTGGQVTERDVRQAAQTTATVGGAAITGGVSLAAGASLSYAMGAAIGTIRPMAQIGALAGAMGQLPGDMEQGLHTSQTLGRGEGFTTVRAVRGLRQDVARSEGTGSALPEDAYPSAEDMRDQQQARAERRRQTAAARVTAPLRGRWEAARRVSEAARSRYEEARRERTEAEESEWPAEVVDAARTREAQARQVQDAAKEIEAKWKQAYDRASLELSGELAVTQAAAREVWEAVRPREGEVVEQTEDTRAGQREPDGPVVDGEVTGRDGPHAALGDGGPPPQLPGGPGTGPQLSATPVPQLPGPGGDDVLDLDVPLHGPVPGSPASALPGSIPAPGAPAETAARDGVQASLDALSSQVASLEVAVTQEQHADTLQRYEEDAQGRALGELRRDAAPSLVPAPAAATPAPGAPVQTEALGEVHASLETLASQVASLEAAQHADIPTDSQERALSELRREVVALRRAHDEQQKRGE